MLLFGDVLNRNVARSWGLLFFVVGLILTSAASYAQTIQITRIDISGNQRVEDATILSYADISTSDALTAGEVNAVGQRLRESGLFEKVAVDVSGSRLRINVLEFPTINKIVVEGNARIDDEALLSLISSESRRVFSPATAEADAQAIAGAYGAAGRVAAVVEPKIIRRSDNRVDLVFEVTEGRVVEIERIAFVGNRNYSDNRLRRVLQTKQAGFLRTLFQNDTFLEDRIAFDQQLLSDFYQSRGYVDFAIQSTSSELTRKRDGFLLTFNIREGQQYRFGEISVSSELPDVDPAKFNRAVRLRSGGIYSPTLIDSTITKLENLATKEALSFVRVEPRVTRNNRERTLDIEFVLVRGERIFIERIDIEGNSTTLDRVVRREFRVVEGDPFNPREIALTADRIRALRYFSQSDVVPRRGTTDDRVIIDVDVIEQSTGSLSFGASYSQDSGVGLVLSFSENNFLGRGQAVQVSLNTSDDAKRFVGSFTEPYLLGRKVRFRTSLNIGQTDDDQATFDTESVGISTSLSYPVGDYSTLGLTYTIQNDEILGVNTASTSAILQAETGSRLTSSVGYAYRYDTRNRGLDPSRGILLRFGQEFAGLGGDSKYVKTSGLIVGEIDVFSEEVTLRGTVEAGNLRMLEGASRASDRFFGTSRYVRGFQQKGFGPRDLNVTNEDSLGGNKFASLRLEAEFPLGLPEELGITGGLYYDIGSVWGLDNTAGGLTGTDPAEVVDDSQIFRSAAGVSIFWTTPIGPLRFNFSDIIKAEDYDRTQTFDLTVSTQF